jgi:non-homologous end joining protein Ku
MSNVDQLKKMIDETEFSDRVQDKVKELSVKARLRKESGQKEEDCLPPEEVEELMTLIKADMILDGLRAKACQANLGEIDKIINSLRK